jgi:thymidylate kinase
MKTIILEGIATSGKSTIIGKIEEASKSEASLKIVPEEQTLMVIVDNKDLAVSISYLNSLLAEVYDREYDLVIFDRLHLTHAFRTNGSIEDYRSIEEQLMENSPEIIFLEVQEHTIAERVKKASEHRDPLWKDYLATKGKDFDEIADYYMNQQRQQMELLKRSKIPYKVFDTTNHDYASVLEHILQV